MKKSFLLAYTLALSCSNIFGALGSYFTNSSELKEAAIKTPDGKYVMVPKEKQRILIPGEKLIVGIETGTTGWQPLDVGKKIFLPSKSGPREFYFKVVKTNRVYKTNKKYKNPEEITIKIWLKDGKPVYMYDMVEMSMGQVIRSDLNQPVIDLTAIEEAKNPKKPAPKVEPKKPEPKKPEPKKEETKKPLPTPSKAPISTTNKPTSPDPLMQAFQVIFEKTIEQMLNDLEIPVKTDFQKDQTKNLRQIYKSFMLKQVAERSGIYPEKNKNMARTIMADKIIEKFLQELEDERKIYYTQKKDSDAKKVNDYINKYRDSLKKSLKTKGYNIEKIDFLVDTESGTQVKKSEKEMSAMQKAKEALKAKGIY